MHSEVLVIIDLFDPCSVLHSIYYSIISDATEILDLDQITVQFLSYNLPRMVITIMEDLTLHACTLHSVA